MDLLFAFMMLVGIVIGGLVILSGNAKVNFKFLGIFLLFMGVITIIRLILMRIGIMSVPKLPFEINYSELFLVPWEDSFFVLIPMYVVSKCPKVKIPVWITFSVLFALGHISYGYVWAAVTLLYPYFISRRITEEQGIGSAFIVHILYDMITLFTIQELVRLV